MPVPYSKKTLKSVRHGVIILLTGSLDECEKSQIGLKTNKYSKWMLIKSLTLSVSI